MDIASILFALAILHAGYLIQLCFRQPSDRKISASSESWIPWLAASPMGTIFVRMMVLCACAYHAALSLAPPDTLHQICRQPKYLDSKLFTWSKTTIACLVLLYVGCYIRFRAYAQLGANFTYRLAKPDALVTNGLYAYVRHPSYTGLLAVLVATHLLVLRQHGLISCFSPEQLATDERIEYLVPLLNICGFVWGFLIPRVRDEEKMMEKEFGQVWRDHCAKTKMFIPFVI